MQILFNILKNAEQKEYKNMRGGAIECITFIANFFGKEKLKPYQDSLI